MSEVGTLVLSKTWEPPMPALRLSEDACRHPPKTHGETKNAAIVLLSMSDQCATMNLETNERKSHHG